MSSGRHERVAVTLAAFLALLASGCASDSAAPSTTVATTTTAASTTSPSTTSPTTTSPATTSPATTVAITVPATVPASTAGTTTSAPPVPPARVAAAPSAGCDAAPSTPGETTFTLTVAGLAGHALQHLPPSYDGTTPLPLVIDLHGYSEPFDVHALMSGLGAFGDTAGFVTVTPDIDRPVPLWDTSLTGGDMAFVAGLLDHLESTLCIDTNRVDVAGLSNGAFMASSIGCALATRVAAIAPVAGLRDPAGCAAARRVPVVAFHGNADQYVAYTGGYGPAVADLPTPDGGGTLGTAVVTGAGGASASDPSIPEIAQTWAARNGCAATPSDRSIASDVTLRAWSCTALAADVELYTIDGGGHTWPGSQFAAGLASIVGRTTMSISANQIMWDFFVAHPLTP